MQQTADRIRQHFSDEEIPILDFGPYLRGENGALESLAAELRHAQENIGFYFIINHTVSTSLIDRTHANLKRFFDLPIEEKNSLENFVPPALYNLCLFDCEQEYRARPERNAQDCARAPSRSSCCKSRFSISWSQ